MICIMSERIKSLCKINNFTLDHLYTIPTMSKFGTSKDIIDKMKHESIFPVRDFNSDIYNIAKFFGIGTDFLYGLSENSRALFVPITSDNPIVNKEKIVQLGRIIKREIHERGDAYNNTNLLSSILDIDRSIIDMILRRPEDAIYVVLPSFEFFAKFCYGFSIDFITLLTYIMDGQTNPDNKTIISKLANLYNSRYNITKDTVVDKNLDLNDNLAMAPKSIYISNNTIQGATNTQYPLDCHIIPMEAAQMLDIRSSDTSVADAAFDALASKLYVNLHNAGTAEIEVVSLLDRQLRQTVTVFCDDKYKTEKPVIQPKPIGTPETIPDTTIKK